MTESISWTLPTLVETKLFARDKKNILALDLAFTGFNLELDPLNPWSSVGGSLSQSSM